MRQEYIEFIKNYLASRPDYKERLQEVKAEILTYGATEDEFYHALQQVGNTQPAHPNTKHFDHEWLYFKKFGEFRNPFHLNKKSLARHLLEVDIATHAIFAIVVIFIFAVYLISPRALENIVRILKAPAAGPATTATAVNTILAPQVYASKEEIDGSRVFTYQPSQITLVASGTPKKEVYGFFPYWMLENQDKIPLNALTSMALFGLEVDGGGNIITSRETGIDPGWEMWTSPLVDRLIQRARNQNVKVELTIKAFDNTNIERLVLSDDAQKTFIANTLNLLQTKPLNGVNLDFEYVGTPTPQVTDGMTRLLTNLRAELKRQMPNASLTIDTYVNEAANPRLIDVEKAAPLIDSFIVMGYDVHTPSGGPGPIAPMEGNLSIVGFMQSYLEKAPSEKIILAIPYYGYDWAVPQIGEEKAKTLPYAEIADVSKNHQILWDDTSQSPYYKYTDANITREVHFENVRSLSIKYDYVKRKNLRGIGIWALGYDGLNSDLRSLIVEKFAN